MSHHHDHHVVEQKTFAQIRMEEFFEFFYKQKLWEFKGTENHPNLGRIDVYQIADHHGHHIREEKQHQIEHAHHADHHHASHQVLPPYRVEHAHQLPKWLPFTVGVKTTANISQYAADNLKSQIEGNLERFWNHHPEFNKVFGYQQVGNEFKVYIELQGTLEQDIRQRAAEHRPYQEELLWKMLYNLTRASYKLNLHGQGLCDIRPSRIYYNQYQVSVVPNGIGQERDGQLHNKFLSGDGVFFSNEHLPHFENHHNLKASGQLRNVFGNESFQIGLTVLAAGLLKSETELNVCRNKTFNHQQLDQLLADFGTIYPSNGKLLQYTLEELFLNAGRQTPAQIYSIFDKETDHFIFLETDLQHHLAHLYQSNASYSRKRADFTHHHPHAHPSLDFKRQYPCHFHYELKKVEYDERIHHLHKHNAEVRVQLGDHHHAPVVTSSHHHEAPVEVKKHTVRHHQPVTTVHSTSHHVPEVVRASGHHGGHVVTEVVRSSGHHHIPAEVRQSGHHVVTSSVHRPAHEVISSGHHETRKHAAHVVHSPHGHLSGSQLSGSQYRTSHHVYK